MNDEQWPALPYDAWKDTYATLHMWMQIAGKVALALAPPLNHGWGVTFHLTPRGLATRPLPHGSRMFTIEFDFIDHRAVIRATDGAERSLKLEPRSVADFDREFLSDLEEMGLPVTIRQLPAEIANPIPFPDDTVHHSYDPDYANRHWRILVQVERVFTAARCSFVGKSSPAHFFWGGFDFALTRFSGRPAPPRQGPAWMRDAYSHEVISHGFWPGSAPVLEAAFYAYAFPEPQGLKEARVEPAAAYYQHEMSEFILPYEAVRTSPDPAAAIRAFVDSTYDRAATLAGWDRAALERP